MERILPVSVGTSSYLFGTR